MKTCKDCVSNEICFLTHTDNSPACIDFRTPTKAELENKNAEINECKNCLYYNASESRCMNDYNRKTYLVILYRHNCESFLKRKNAKKEATNESRKRL